MTKQKQSPDIDTDAQRTSRRGVTTVITLTLVVGVVLAASISPLGVVAAATDFSVTTNAPETVNPDETIDITYTIENTGDTALESLALSGSPQTSDTELTITDAASDSAVTITEDNRLIFETVEPGASVTATLTVAVGTDATGTETLTAEITNGFGEDAVTKQTVTELTVANKTVDSDNDGLSDAREEELGTNPTVADTDGDGLDDGPEINDYGTNATVADTDGDGLEDGPEINDYGTNATVADTDGDGLDDGPEINDYGTNATVADTDGDGLDDGPEINDYGTNATVADTDGDGLDDGPEVNDYGTNATVDDTDGDRLLDGEEVNGETTDGVELPESDPLSMDLYVQVSYGGTATSRAEAFFDDLRSQWATMPVENPDGTEGIDLHVQEGPAYSETVTFTGDNADSIRAEYYSDNVGDGEGVYHNVMFVEFDDEGEFDGYSSPIPGRFAVVEANMETRNQRNMIVHELLHGVVGEIDSDAACADDPIHICQDGWLQSFVYYNEDEFLSDPTAEEIGTDGFEESYAERSTITDYANDQDVVDVDGLLDALDDWRGGEIGVDLLLDVLDAWRSGDPVS